VIGAVVEVRYQSIRHAYRLRSLHNGIRTRSGITENKNTGGIMTLEQEILEIMERPKAFDSWQEHGAGMTFYDYVAMVVVEYKKIAVNVYA
jgi:hypothetical protein